MDLTDGWTDGCGARTTCLEWQEVVHSFARSHSIGIIAESDLVDGCLVDHRHDGAINPVQGLEEELSQFAIVNVRRRV